MHREQWRRSDLTNQGSKRQAERGNRFYRMIRPYWMHTGNEERSEHSPEMRSDVGALGLDRDGRNRAQSDEKIWWGGASAHIEGLDGVVLARGRKGRRKRPATSSPKEESETTASRERPPAWCPCRRGSRRHRRTVLTSRGVVVVGVDEGDVGEEDGHDRTDRGSLQPRKQRRSSRVFSVLEEEGKIEGMKRDGSARREGGRRRKP